MVIIHSFSYGGDDKLRADPSLNTSPYGFAVADDDERDLQFSSD